VRFGFNQIREKYDKRPVEKAKLLEGMNETLLECYAIWNRLQCFYLFFLCFFVFFWPVWTFLVWVNLHQPCLPSISLTKD